MPTTTLKPKTTKGGSATKPSLTNASAEKSRKMLEQMLAKKLSSSTKVPKTMTIKTGATKKSTATRSASAGATKGRKGGSNVNTGYTVHDPYMGARGHSLTKEQQNAVRAAHGYPEVPSTVDYTTPDNSTTDTTDTTAVKAATNGEINDSMPFKCRLIEPPSAEGGYRKKGTPVKKSSCAMSSKRPMSAKPTKKSMSTKPKSAKK